MDWKLYVIVSAVLYFVLYIFVSGDVDDDELMLNVLRCHLTY